ncbi:TonB-dependent receptor [Simiduia sp. 21SJ11W-1]|uniref:TonB-dependent receptor n=1 Tax=Simiduia sp. 21SJ11W-1 TaxID=2909669 RepID=UPI0020A048E8|nr:TonB-dependent receptor [Simiduia sp. 21SJ11W-1]UTA48793.1 TonB-dependent receptor [Simiduia sp. 21SJ11W-1]
MHKAQQALTLLTGIAIGASLPYHSAQAALDGKVVPAQTLATSPLLADHLIELGRKSDISIVFPSKLLAGKLAPKITTGHHKLPTLEALSQLLAGSGLTYKIINDQVIAITELRASNKPAEAPPVNYYLEEIAVVGQQVTGSRIRNSNLLGASPVDVISQPELAGSGAQSLGEFLKFIPTVAGNSTSTAVSNGGDGTATVTLRGLPANNTLVLLNGQRTAYAGLAGDAIDLNSIPPAAVERIEILKDGASALYGSDAIAGVVNIIMRQSFDGFQLEQFYGETSRADLETSTTNVLWGHKSTSGSIMLAGSHYQQQGINSRDRSVSASADNRPLGGTDLRSSATPDGRYQLSDGVYTLRDGSDGSTPADFRAATNEDLFNYSRFTSAVSPSTRTSLYSSGRLELNHSLTGFFDASYTATSATITLAPTPLFTDFEREPLPISATQPYNPFGEPVEDLRKRLLEMGNRDQINKAQSYRLNWGLDGDTDTLHWRLNQFWSRTDASVDYTNLVSGQQLQNALADECNATPDCVPLNLFGPTGSITPEMAHYIRASSKITGHSQLLGANLVMDTAVSDLPAGQLLAAGGVEIRREDTRRQPFGTEDFLIGGGETSETQGARSIVEMFAEAQIPLIKDASWAKSLDVEVAARSSYYSDFGTASTPKIGLLYQPAAGILLRGTASKGFRAPSLNELHKGGKTTQSFLDDPCADPQNVGVLPGCSQQSDPTRTQYLTVFGGSQELKPERSTNRTLGVVWTPPRLPGLYTNLDFFWIEQKNVVDASAQYIIDQNAENGAFSDRVNRNTDGELESINASFLNIGQRSLSGIDLALRYQQLLQDGVVTYSVNAAHLRNFKDQLTPGTPAEDIAGTFSDEASEGNGSLPKWKANAGLNWKQHGLDLHYTLNFISKLEENIPKSANTRFIKSWVTHDIQLSYVLPVQKGLTITLGADNLLDAPAPFAASAFNDSMDARTHDLKGRYWYGRVSLSL